MPEPVLIAIAAALAGKAAEGLYDVVRRRFKGRPEAEAALEAAQGAAPDSFEVRALSEELAQAEHLDPEFAADLRAAWDQAAGGTHVDHGAVVNQVTGDVSGKVLQARDIQGGVSF